MLALDYGAITFAPYGDICLVDSVPNTIDGHIIIIDLKKSFVKRCGNKGRLLTSPRARKNGVWTCGSGRIVGCVKDKIKEKICQ
jgi:hypothetical protein